MIRPKQRPKRRTHRDQAHSAVDAAEVLVDEVTFVCCTFAIVHRIHSSSFSDSQVDREDVGHPEAEEVAAVADVKINPIQINYAVADIQCIASPCLPKSIATDRKLQTFPHKNLRFTFIL